MNGGPSWERNFIHVWNSDKLTNFYLKKKKNKKTIIQYKYYDSMVGYIIKKNNYNFSKINYEKLFLRYNLFSNGFVLKMYLIYKINVGRHI